MGWKKGREGEGRWVRERDEGGKWRCGVCMRVIRRIGKVAFFRMSCEVGIKVTGQGIVWVCVGSRW